MKIESIKIVITKSDDDGETQIKEMNFKPFVVNIVQGDMDNMAKSITNERVLIDTRQKDITKKIIQRMYEGGYKGSDILED